ncbi:MAG: HAD hydrolase-like protein [Alphaproteobacteria bacterium]
MHDYLIFDLDGTLSNPQEGIVKSINYALKQCGYAAQPADSLLRYIGPPLDESFADLIGQNHHDEIARLVHAYRERYAQIGYKENVIYDGIVESLNMLADQNIPMGVCTSKPERFARPILEMFGIHDYFDFVSGGDVGIQKRSQLHTLLNDGVVSSKSVMIGDRAVDMIAAQLNDIKCAGVLWGHGTFEEIDDQNPDIVLHKPSDLKGLCSAR